MVRSQTIRTGAILITTAIGVAALGPVAAPVHAASKPARNHHNQRSHPNQRIHFNHQYQGYLTATPPSTSAPTTLTIQTPNRGQISASVTSSTKIIRLYGAASGLDELSANDVLQVRGTTTAPGAVTATWIRDISIHAAYGRLAGVVTAVNTAVTPNTVSVVVRRDPHTPFVYGQNVTIPVDPSTQVVSGTTTVTGSAGSLAAGNRIVALGVYNNNSRTFQSTFRIRVLGTGSVKPHPVNYTGYLTAAPVTTTAPVSLTIQTPHDGLVTVAVDANAKIVRRFNGASDLDELGVNDILQVRGVTIAPGVVAATVIRDTSIQEAYTRLVGLVTAVNTAVTPNTVAVVVQRDARRSPFRYGQNVTLPVGSSTQVISGTTTTTGSAASITVGERITALGVFDRIANTFQSTFRIRVLKG